MIMRFSGDLSYLTYGYYFYFQPSVPLQNQFSAIGNNKEEYGDEALFGAGPGANSGK